MSDPKYLRKRYLELKKQYRKMIGGNVKAYCGRHQHEKQGAQILCNYNKSEKDNIFHKCIPKKITEGEDLTNLIFLKDKIKSEEEFSEFTYGEDIELEKLTLFNKNESKPNVGDKYYHCPTKYGNEAYRFNLGEEEEIYDYYTENQMNEILNPKEEPEKSEPELPKEIKIEDIEVEVNEEDELEHKYYHKQIDYKNEEKNKRAKAYKELAQSGILKTYITLQTYVIQKCDQFQSKHCEKYKEELIKNGEDLKKHIKEIKEINESGNFMDVLDKTDYGINDIIDTYFRIFHPNNLKNIEMLESYIYGMYPETKENYNILPNVSPSMLNEEYMSYTRYNKKVRSQILVSAKFDVSLPEESKLDIKKYIVDEYDKIKNFNEEVKTKFEEANEKVKKLFADTYNPIFFNYMVKAHIKTTLLKKYYLKNFKQKIGIMGIFNKIKDGDELTNDEKKTYVARLIEGYVDGGQLPIMIEKSIIPYLINDYKKKLAGISRPDIATEHLKSFENQFNFRDIKTMYDLAIKYDKENKELALEELSNIGKIVKGEIDKIDNAIKLNQYVKKYESKEKEDHILEYAAEKI